MRFLSLLKILQKRINHWFDTNLTTELLCTSLSLLKILQKRIIDLIQISLLNCCVPTLGRMVSRVSTDPNTSVIDCHHSPCIGPLYCSHLNDNKSISTPLDSSSTTPCYLYEYITQLIKLKDLQKHDSYHKKNNKEKLKHINVSII